VALSSCDDATWLSSHGLFPGGSVPLGEEVTVESAPIEERQERAARNQSLFREVNERLEEVMGELSMFHEFICECAEPECSEQLSMTHDEYEVIREHPARFAVMPGHVVSEVEQVVGGAPDRYVVVEKIERAAEIAAHFDPRLRRQNA
jgi:hypothetical protein